MSLGQEVRMRLLRLAIETQKWDLAAHVLILGAIAARQRDNDRVGSKQEKQQKAQQQQG
jgi:hypothetical protein